jgi:hypothetical protein
MAESKCWGCIQGLICRTAEAGEWVVVREWVLVSVGVSGLMIMLGVMQGRLQGL